VIANRRGPFDGTAASATLADPHNCPRISTVERSQMQSYLHLAKASPLGLGEARKLSQDVSGINAKTAIVVPAILGSMPFFWFANVLALCSLPAVLTGFDNEVLKHALGLESFFPHVILKAAMIALIAWIAQTYIQLVALPVLQVSNNAQMTLAEEHTKTLLAEGAATRQHTEAMLDWMNLETKGGAQLILARIEEVAKDRTN
jgi:hypothetical protein